MLPSSNFNPPVPTPASGSEFLLPGIDYVAGGTISIHFGYQYADDPTDSDSSLERSSTISDSLRTSTSGGGEGEGGDEG